ncbi:MAG TPA: UDP-glucuronic acid decarboxylase family protein [Thermomicrobiaceae bacterium]|nr:UDP-glucuronic acid decarboxylase family protein [Thermomicrobiaceae bacterium]
MRVLVSGAAGFIGSHLCDALLDQGATVIGIDNLITGREENIAHLGGQAGFEFIQHDIIDPVDVTVDRIFHLASPASPVGYMRHPFETMLVNSRGTHNLLKMAHAQGARLLFASTSEVYGDPLEHPQTEAYFGNVNPVGPRSCYDESKRFGEALTMEFVRQYNVDARIVRIFNTYGPRNDPRDGRVVPNFVMRALAGEPLVLYGSGEQTRSLCYVSDLVRGLLLMMERDGLSGEIVNLGNPEERTMLDLAETIISLCDSRSTIVRQPARPDDPARRRPDISKARRLLGWEPAVSLEAGMSQTVAYFSRYVEPGVSATADR